LVGVLVAASVSLILNRNLIRFIFGLVLAGNAIEDLAARADGSAEEVLTTVVAKL